MKTDLVRIGNSRGIRIPKPIIEQCRLGDSVDLRIEDDKLVISAHRATRQGWSEAFTAAKRSMPDPLLLDDMPANKFDEEEWEW
jgi:antitoxin MazE